MKNEIAVIPDYTAEQFYDTTEPYEFLYQYRDNKFLMKQMTQKMKDKAGAVGVKCFVALFNAYCEMMAQKNGVILANSTQFDGQEMELFSGEYICDENGVFLVDKYGYENMLSAVVHVDETTPHMHLNFVPINDGRLSSKSLFDRQKLAELQTELWEQVGKKYGLQRGKENSQATHITAAEHKAKVIVQSAEQKRDEIDRQTEQKQAELDGLTQTVEAVTQATGKPIPKKKKQAADEITALRAKNTLLEEEIKRGNRDRADVFQQYMREKRRADGYEKTVQEVAEIKAILPEGYAQLLQDVQDEKAARYERERQQNLARIRGRNKDYYM